MKCECSPHTPLIFPLTNYAFLYNIYVYVNLNEGCTWGGGGSSVEDVKGVCGWGATSILMYSAYTDSTCTYVCTYGRNWMGGGLGLGCNWHMSLIYCMGPLCLF